MYRHHRRQLVSLVVGASLLLLGSSATLGQVNYFAPSTTGVSGSVTTVTISMDSPAGSPPIQGFSMGVCTDAAVIAPNMISQGADVAATNGGAGADFFDTETPPGGFTCGCVINFIGMATLPSGVNLDLVDVDYDVLGGNGTQSLIEFCNTLGQPTVSNAIVVNGAAITPIFNDGVFDVQPAAAVVFSIAPSGVAVPNGSLDVAVEMENSIPVFGFSFGLSFDPVAMNLGAVTASGVLGATNGGSGPDFLDVDLFPGGGTGATVECTISTAPPVESISAGAFQELLTLDFDFGFSIGPPCSTLPLTFVDTLGVPLEAIGPSGPELAAGTLGEIVIGTVQAAPPTGGITLAVDSTTATPGVPVASRVTLDTDTEIEALSFGISYQPGDVSLASVDQGLNLAQLRCGAGPEFFSAETITGLEFGVTIASVFAISPPIMDRVLFPGADQEIAVLNFVTNPAPGGSGTPLTFTDTLGTVPVAIEVTVNAQAVSPVTVDGSIDFGSGFTRGNCNVDGMTDLGDAIFLLGSLFPGPGGPNLLACADACDANDDGMLDVGDAVALLGSLFGGTFTVPPPLNCGADPTPTDPLGCGSFSVCP